MAEKQLTAQQEEMLQAARTFIERLKARARQCDQIEGMGPLTRGFDNSANELARDLEIQIRSFRDNSLLNAAGSTVDKS